MPRLATGLARQIAVAAAMSALLIAGLSVQPDFARRAPANASLDKPIATRAIVIAEAPPAPQQVKLASPAKSAAPPRQAPRPRVAAPPPRPADPAPQVVTAAYVAPAPEAEPRFDLKKRLFAPVGFVRDNVARLISWL